MAQERLQGLALLCIESDIAKTIDYDSVIDTFAGQEGQKSGTVRCESGMAEEASQPTQP